MIIDLVDNWEKYPFGPAWRTAFKFISSLDTDAEEITYKLQGDDIYARVMSYKSIEAEEGKLEAHRKYVDIQSTIISAEGIEWYPISLLGSEITPYNHLKDVFYFKRPQNYSARLNVYPGMFAFFLPHDAHLPKLTVGEIYQLIKKVVVKINIRLLKLK